MVDLIQLNKAHRKQTFIDEYSREDVLVIYSMIFQLVFSQIDTNYNTDTQVRQLKVNVMFFTHSDWTRKGAYKKVDAVRVQIE